jgi:hypothetical protein
MIFAKLVILCSCVFLTMFVAPFCSRVHTRLSGRMMLSIFLILLALDIYPVFRG